MKGVSVDKNGIPILTRPEIEIWAEKFIRFFSPRCLEEPSFTPLGTICSKLRDEHDVNFVFGIDLGTTKEGYKYRGQFDIATTTIFIDQSLENSTGRFNFTLAHELAHFVLHRKINTEVLRKKTPTIIKDTSRDLILDHLQSDNPRTWLEWQANKFASSLLMPRATIHDAVKNKQIKMGINRNIGKIYLSRQSSSYKDFNEQMEFLCSIYQTSKSSLRIRLRELAILFEEDEDAGLSKADKEPLHMKEHLSNIIANWVKN